jgi:hypothetical protein
LKFDFPRFVRAIVNRGGNNPTLAAVLQAVAEATAELATIPDRELVRGHDMMALLAEVLKDMGVCRKDSPRLVRMGFDRARVPDYPNLESVVEFVCADA